MRFKCFFIVLLTGLMLQSGQAFSESEAAPTNNLLNINMKGPQPITITSDRAALDNKSHTAVHTGNVVIKRGDLTLYSDEITTWFDKDAKRIDKIEATGRVKLLHLNRIITAETGTYLDQEQKIILTGNPVCKEGDNMLTGSCITYFIAEDKIVVDDAKSILHPQAEKHAETQTTKP
jgi:lipopolysaccharide export system protein LptA